MSETLSSLNDKAVVQEFVTYLSNNGHPGLRVDRCPDEENRDTPDIDAIAGKFAIEHTSIDTVTNQRRNDAWFMEAAGSLESQLRGRLPFRLSLTLPYEAIALKQDWTAIKAALCSWIMNDAFSLPEGSNLITDGRQIPFHFRASKSTTRKPGLFFSRFSPTDSSLHKRVQDLFDRKAKKLSPYRSQGHRTILLVESNDIALMNELVLREAVQVAYPQGMPRGVDEIWFADTSIMPGTEFRDITDAVQ